MDKNHIVKVAPVIVDNVIEKNNSFQKATIINLERDQEIQLKSLSISDEQDIDYFSVKITLTDDDYNVTSFISQEVFPGVVKYNNPAKIEIYLQEYYDASLTVEILKEDKSLIQVIPHAQRVVLSVTDLITLSPREEKNNSFYVVIKSTDFRQFGVLNYSVNFSFSHAYFSGSFHPKYDLRELDQGRRIDRPRPPITKYRDFAEMERYTMEALNDYLDENHIRSDAERKQAIASVQIRLSQLAADSKLHNESKRLLESSAYIHDRLDHTKEAGTIRKMISRIGKTEGFFNP